MHNVHRSLFFLIFLCFLSPVVSLIFLDASIIAGLSNIWKQSIQSWKLESWLGSWLAAESGALGCGDWQQEDKQGLMPPYLSFSHFACWHHFGLISLVAGHAVTLCWSCHHQCMPHAKARAAAIAVCPGPEPPHVLGWMQAMRSPVGSDPAQGMRWVWHPCITVTDNHISI